MEEVYSFRHRLFFEFGLTPIRVPFTYDYKYNNLINSENRRATRCNTVWVATVLTFSVHMGDRHGFVPGPGTISRAGDWRAVR
jgi:hypothetical protein